MKTWVRLRLLAMLKVTLELESSICDRITGITVDDETMRETRMVKDSEEWRDIIDLVNREWMSPTSLLFKMQPLTESQPFILPPLYIFINSKLLLYAYTERGREFCFMLLMWRLLIWGRYPLFWIKGTSPFIRIPPRLSFSPFSFSLLLKNIHLNKI